MKARNADRLRRLLKRLVSRIPKKPPAPSVRRGAAKRQRVS
jgi:hypothetical protein